ncbi:SurA N-terminal domain-containing protein [Phytohalomonas tamaricis]|uniref:SurA N-terminal domain-containing protein n=1 Tax=Phytohalomonas tamaricis TaxID=2081032 RepID=UPI000D0BBCC8|nr:SurA N-terminal domain-containing protein [Phytohalomonas tamaricis]
MLQRIRDRSQGWIAKIIVALIVITFAFFGVESIIGAFTGDSNDVATVNGEAIKRQDVETQVQRAIRSGQVPPEQEREARAQIIDQMISRKLLQQYARKGDLAFSDAQVDQMIVGLPEFQDQQGHFSRDLFVNRLASAGYTPASFRAQLKEDMVIQQLQQGLASGSFVLPSERERLNALQNQTRTFRYAMLSENDLETPVTVSDAEIEQYYANHQDAYKRPEQIKLKYVVLDQNDMAQDRQIDEATLQQAYAERRSAAPRQVSDIIVNYGDERSESEAQARIKEVQDKLAQGADFSALAQQYSDDSSKQNGGDLGVVTKGIFGDKFDQAVYSLDEGQVSQPVQFDNAYHLLKVTNIDVPSFDDMRADLIKQARLDAAKQAFQDKAQRLKDESFSADDLKSVANDLGLTLRQSDWLSQDSANDIFAEPGVMDAAFNDDVLNRDNVEQGYNSEVIELDDQRRMVLRVSDYRPATTLPLEQVRDQVRRALETEKLQQALTERADDIVASLRQGEDVALEWKKAQAVTRNEHPDVDQGIIDAAYRLPRPDKGSTYGHTGVEGREVVIALDRVGQKEDSDAASFIASMAERLQAQTAVRGLSESLRKNADIDRN